jgi:energy-coupling factor transporter transmembrane protein EcfT
MDKPKDKSYGRLRNLFFFYVITIIAIVALVVVANVFKVKLAEEILPAVWVFLAIIFIGTLVVILLTLLKILDAVEDGSPKEEKVADELEKIREIVRQINQATRLSETAKTIAFRDADAQVLREVVFDKLQQKDFDTAYEIIDEITHRISNIRLAEELHIQADKYRDSDDMERMLQSITHIEKLLEGHQWAKASAQIERLIREYPGQNKALAMRQRLTDKKEERKKVLLNAWDDAVKRQLTDRSLEILRDLDQYLTPNEGLALQEAARDVFRTKLHNLGVQFSLAISGKQWARAFDTGMEIIRDFPNSRMAEEIREKIDILKTHALQKS